MARNLWINGLSGRSKSGREGDWAACLPALLDALHHAQDGPVAFADCAFPRHILNYADPDATLLRLPKGEDLDLFHDRFHSADSGKPIIECTAKALEKLAAGRRLWLFVDDISEMGPLLPVLKRLGVCLFALQDRNATPDAADWTAINVIFDDGAPTGFLLFLPQEIFWTSRFAVQAEPPRQGWPHIRKPAEDALNFVIGIDELLPVDLMLSANRVITDNAYLAEQEKLWSWMWIGPGQMARFAVGRVPQDTKRLEVHFIASERNLSLRENLALQLDGKAAAHHSMFSPDGSGRAWVELGDAPFTILTIACRIPHHVSDRILRACIARIGFAA